MVTAIGGVVYPNRTPQNQRPSQQQRPPEHRPSHLILISLSSGIYHHHDISLSTQASAYARRQCHPQIYNDNDIPPDKHIHIYTPPSPDDDRVNSPPPHPPPFPSRP